MRYGDLVTITRDGIIGSPKEFEAIGINPQSACWGVPVPDSQLDPLGTGSPSVPHLILSSIDPESWPALFRIDLKLELARPNSGQQSGSLVKAAGVLTDCGLNILSYDCTPSGHRHLTWTLLGEWELVTRGEERASLKPPRPSGGQRHIGDPQILAFINQSLAPRMIRQSERIISQITERDRKESGGGFLCSALVPDAGTGRLPAPFGGQLYDPAQMDADLRDAAETQRIRPLTCRWIQHLAFFSVFGEVESRITFRFDERKDHECILRPVGNTSEDRYQDWLQRIGRDLPTQRIALFDPNDAYIRIVPTQTSQQSELMVSFPYKAKFTARAPTSKGLLHRLFTELNNRRLSVVHVANTITSRNETLETNRIRLIARTTSQDVKSVVDELQHALATQPQFWQERLGFRLTVDQEALRVAPLAARTLFVATRFGWERWLTEGKARVAEIAIRYGFRATWGGERPTAASDYSLLSDSEARVAQSQAFLAILPDLPPERGDLNWALYEYGFAGGRGIPRAICVDTRGGKSIQQWATDLRVSPGRYLMPFNDATLWKVVEEAMDLLGEQVTASHTRTSR